MERQMIYLTCNINDAALFKSVYEQTVEDDRWGYVQHKGIKNMLITIGAYATDAQMDELFHQFKTLTGKKFQIQFG